MTRVLQAMAGAEFGGAEAFFVRLTQALHRAGIDQHVVIREHARRAATLEAAGLPPAQLPFGGRLDFRTRFGLRREIAAFRPDIVMTWMNRATRFCPSGRFIHVGRLGGYYDLKYYRHCDHLIGNTQDIVDYVVRQGWPAERAHYLPNFVSAERAAPIQRMAHYTPDGSPLMLALGRLHANKAFDVLLKAMAYVPDAYLWIAGEGPLRLELETLAAQIGVKPRVRFLGWRDDVPALLATADAFICPSRHEPLGNVVLEAWAQGLPVVAAASTGPAALIADGDSGLLVPVDDVTALARALRRLLNDGGLADRLAEGGRQAFEANFTEAAVVGCYRDFFEQIIGSRQCAASQAS